MYLILIGSALEVSKEKQIFKALNIFVALRFELRACACWAGTLPFEPHHQPFLLYFLNRVAHLCQSQPEPQSSYLCFLCG
jgi:hypothetical protein